MLLSLHNIWPPQIIEINFYYKTSTSLFCTNNSETVILYIKIVFFFHILSLYISLHWISFTSLLLRSATLGLSAICWFSSLVLWVIKYQRSCLLANHLLLWICWIGPALIQPHVACHWWNSCLENWLFSPLCLVGSYLAFGWRGWMLLPLPRQLPFL